LNILDDRGITALNTFFEQILRLRSTSIDLALADRIKLLAKKTGIIKQIETDPRSEADFNHLIAWAETETGQPREILNKISLQTDTDTFIPRAEKVALMTMHAAKGLEFSVVFIAGCENGYIPMEPIKNDLIDIDEERRLFYVAMTRAKDMLFLTRSRNRYIHGKLQQRTVSPFIEDIEKKLRAEKKETYKKKAAKKQKQLYLFK